MNIIGWLLFGLVVGAIAKFLMPGRDPGGWIVTILLGIAGSFVGGFLATTIMGRNEQTAGWIGSIIGAMVLLFIYRLIVGRRSVVWSFRMPLGMRRGKPPLLFSASRFSALSVPCVFSGRATVAGT